MSPSKPPQYHLTLNRDLLWGTLILPISAAMLFFATGAVLPVIMVIFAVGWLFPRWRNRNCIRSAGARLLEPVPLPWRKSDTFMVALFGVAIAVSGINIGYAVAMDRLFTEPASRLDVFWCAFLLFILCRWVSPERQIGVDLREHGIVFGMYFCPWDRVMSYRWDKTCPDRLLIGYRGYGYLPCRIATQQRDDIDRILREHIARPLEPVSGHTGTL